MINSIVITRDGVIGKIQSIETDHAIIAHDKTTTEYMMDEIAIISETLKQTEIESLIKSITHTEPTRAQMNKVLELTLAQTTLADPADADTEIDASMPADDATADDETPTPDPIAQQIEVLKKQIASLESQRDELELAFEKVKYNHIQLQRKFDKECEDHARDKRELINLRVDQQKAITNATEEADRTNAQLRRRIAELMKPKNEWETKSLIQLSKNDKSFDESELTKALNDGWSIESIGYSVVPIMDDHHHYRYTTLKRRIHAAEASPTPTSASASFRLKPFATSIVADGSDALKSQLNAEILQNGKRVYNDAIGKSLPALGGAS